MRRPPIVIAHRGASGYVPEHTLAAYFIAIQQGADFIEPDLVMTRDGVLVARHENEISQTTDVAAHAEFAQRRCCKVIDGLSVEGWFTEDFTLAELKRLRVIERLPELRPCNRRFDNMFQIPTLDEILRLVRAMHSMHRAAIGVYPETKHPSYFAALGLPMEGVLVGELERHDCRGHQAAVFIQSFETGNLRALRQLTAVPLVQLADDHGQPFDFVLTGDRRTYAELMSPEGLREIAQYANAVGVNKNLIMGDRESDELPRPSALVENAHTAGLDVHVWTLRAENHFLPRVLRKGENDFSRGNLQAEIEMLLTAGVDGFFTDHPDVGVRARDRFLGVKDEAVNG